ncbi:MAG: hypothetical protein HYW88_02325 [Candidatus Sungbacteria bacterium]|nr:hypothetical protein [Candidatus Sungbacteria bacterium]
MCDQPYYKGMFGERKQRYPNAEYLGENGIYIGCYPKLTKEQMDFMAKSIKEGLANNAIKEAKEQRYATR